MVDKDKLICPYCYEKDGHIAGKAINTYNLKPTAGYTEPTIGVDYLNIFILKGKENTIYNTLIVSPPGVRKDYSIKRYNKKHK